MENNQNQSHPSSNHSISQKESLEMLSRIFGQPVTMGKQEDGQENVKEIIFLRKRNKVTENSLFDAYLKTTFVVFNTQIKIKIGETCNKLNEFLKQKNCIDWAFITPWNPKSVTLSHTENNLRMKQLISMINQFEFFAGEGIGEDKSYLPERSLLILGISRQKAEEIGIHFKQNAIVFGQLNSVAELIDLTDKI